MANARGKGLGENNAGRLAAFAKKICSKHAEVEGAVRRAVTAAIQGIGTALNTQFTSGGVQVGQPANQIGRSQAGGS